jgi:predicted metal-dependent hydrolase
MNVPVRPKGELMSFYYGDEKISFTRLARKSESSKVLIKVHPDCQVVALAPEAASGDSVLSAVKKRGRWIYQQLSEFKTQLADYQPRKYVSGESHYYLGKQYLLKVIEAPDTKPSVKLLRGSIEVTVRSKSPEKVTELLKDWYRLRAKETFARRLDAMLEQALWVENRPPIRVLTMQTQWGSCSPKGRVTLNPHLVKAPRDCIDYVILHELCHIAEHNHSERFYRLMGQVMPNWEKTKERLDSMAGKLFL